LCGLERILFVIDFDIAIAIAIEFYPADYADYADEYCY
jgi:hypothetical protein